MYVPTRYICSQTGGPCVGVTAMGDVCPVSDDRIEWRGRVLLFELLMGGGVSGRRSSSLRIIFQCLEEKMAFSLEGVTYARKDSCDLTSLTHTWRSRGSWKGRRGQMSDLEVQTVTFGNRR